MAKKALKQSDKPVLSRKDLARASFDRALKNAVRRSISRSQSADFDEAIPESFRFATKPETENPSVKLEATSSLSPFILELRSPVPTPQAILADESFANIRLNFLSEVAETKKTDTSKDLQLSSSELKGQIAEFTQPEIPTMRGLFHTHFMFRAKHTPEMMPLTITKQQHISADVFEPKSVPKDILSYFDLPEEDNAEEAEALVDLNDLFEVSDSSVLTDETAQKPSWFQTFALVTMPNGWQRTIGVFVMLSFVFVLPLHAMQLINQLRDAKSHAESNSAQALQNLKDAAGANLVTDPSTANAHFEQANIEFSKAKENITDLGAGISLILSNLAPTEKTFKTNTALLKMGSELSIAGARISDGFTAMQQEINPTPSSKLEILHLYLGSALPHLQAAQDAMNNVDINTIDTSHKDTYAQLTSTLPSLVASTKDFVSLADTLSSILGTDQTKHYLLVFQNNTEIRPTGGFMGSFAEMTVHNGVMEELNIPGGGTYDLQGQQKQTFVAPWPLQLLSAKWEFQDANWFPDFRTSARHIMSFYKNARGMDIDGVIAINANYVQDLIGLLGPVDMPEYGRTIDSANFISETQKIVETEYDKTANKPKAFIGALAPKLIEKALHDSPDTFLTLADSLNRGLSAKDIQLYFTDESVEKNILLRGWGGDIRQTDKDYLMVINTNLGGGKTDGVMQEKVDVDVTISEDGHIENTVTISRTHLGDPLDSFTGVNNVNYERIYVPKGSVLTHAEGFQIPSSSLFESPDPNWIVDPDLQFADASFDIQKESGTQIYEENGKTVFGNWTQTKPGTTSISKFSYTLPFSFTDLLKQQTKMDEIKSWMGLKPTETYSLLIQKQSGITNRTTTVRVHLPDSIKILWNSSDLSHAEFENSQDNFISALFEPTL